MAGYVFLSYSRHDREYVDRLVSFFRAGGVDVWADHEIDYGARWLTVIRDRIDQCSAFVLVMTPQAEDSQWVAEEVARADQMHKLILPLLLDGRPFFGMTGTQYHPVQGGLMPRPDFVEFLRSIANSSTTPVANRRPLTGRLVHVLTGSGGALPTLALAWGPDGHLATGNGDRAALVWRLPIGTVATTLDTGAPVTSIAWSPDGGQLAVGLDDGSVQLWRPDPAELVTRLVGHTNAVLSVSWSRNGRRLATGSRDREVRLWDVAEGSQHGEPLRGHEAAVGAVAWAPDGRTLATADFHGTVLLWGTDGVRRASLSDTAGIPSMCWSPDGRRLLTGSEGSSARIWTLDGAPPRVLSGHTSSVWAVAWSPDGREVATGSFDRTVSVWDADTGERLLVLDEPRGEVNDIGFSPDGRQLAAASDDARARIWDL